MQRELKFRIWDKRNLQWATDFYIIPETGKLWCENAAFIPDDFVIMQYTNLKDGNNKELYEGDLIDYKDYMFLESPYLVEFHNGFFGIKHKIDNTIYPIDPEYYFEIIGNVFENPELLETSQCTK